MKKYPFKRMSALCIDILFAVRWKVIFILSSLYSFSLSSQRQSSSTRGTHLIYHRVTFCRKYLLCYYFIFYWSLLFFQSIRTFSFYRSILSQEGIHTFLSFSTALPDDEHVSAFSNDQFSAPQDSNYFLELEGNGVPRKLFSPYVGVWSYFPNFCIMPTEKRTCVYVLAIASM